MTGAVFKQAGLTARQWRVYLKLTPPPHCVRRATPPRGAVSAALIAGVSLPLSPAQQKRPAAIMAAAAPAAPSAKTGTARHALSDGGPVLASRCSGTPAL